MTMSATPHSKSSRTNHQLDPEVAAMAETMKRNNVPRSHERGSRNPGAHSSRLCAAPDPVCAPSRRRRSLEHTAKFLCAYTFHSRHLMQEHQHSSGSMAAA